MLAPREKKSEQIYVSSMSCAVSTIKSEAWLSMSGYFHFVRLHRLCEFLQAKYRLEHDVIGEAEEEKNDQETYGTGFL